jgi:uncharacterized protein (TIGR00375 family)
MAYVADLHIHSRFAGACSGQLTVPNLAKWAKYKGIDLLGTGDSLHPQWYQEMKATLTEAGGGIYQHGGVKFVVSTEVACIYSEFGKGRRVHILIYFPSLESAAKFAEKLKEMGLNYAYEGRPMLGISCKKLCDLVFSVESKAVIIPAHIWTPWYGMYGDKSGYDKFVDCFGEFSDEIYAIETGLSSDPAMNWRVGELDNKSIVSFSDLHSLPRLGREVTLFKGKLNFDSLRSDLKSGNLVGSIEFFPEEGKYHYSGHRSCGVVLDPEQLKKNGEICPKCQRPLTIGVMQRVEELATRKHQVLVVYSQDGVYLSKKFPNRPGYRMLVQLEEIIAEALRTSVQSQKVKDEYIRLVTNLDTELKILTKLSVDLIAMTAGDKIAEGVKRVREGKLNITPGFDNTYGVVQIWDEEEKKDDLEQINLF